jgi:tRNA (guanine37-N1)-methyltransferase
VRLEASGRSTPPQAGSKAILQPIEGYLALVLRIDFVTLFPEMVLPALDHSILRRAKEAGIVAFGATNPRDFTTDKHRTVDDAPFGGGPGMLMKIEPIVAAVEALGAGRGAPSVRREASGVKSEDGSGPNTQHLTPNTDSDLNTQHSTLNTPPPPRASIVLTDPTGAPFTQADAQELARCEHVVFLCGHYEGIDDRIRNLATRVFSVGDFILTGGELPAMLMADAIVRTIPGVLGSAESLDADSHSDGLLSAPQYTRPEEFNGWRVPEVLLSGNHGAIAKWRREQSLKRTRDLRPDLLAKACLEKKDLDMLSS